VVYHSRVQNEIPTSRTAAKGALGVLREPLFLFGGRRELVPDRPEERPSGGPSHVLEPLLQVFQEPRLVLPERGDVTLE
jgi:hypothetical protein